ncbi:hypothetical protein [Nocardia brasiliensis]
MTNTEPTGSLPEDSATPPTAASGSIDEKKESHANLAFVADEPIYTLPR